MRIMSRKSLSVLFTMGVLLLLQVSVRADNVLFKKGKSDYKIVVAKEASLSEKTAARELQDYLFEVSGARMPIVNDLQTKGKKIIVGYVDGNKALKDVAAPQKDDESFTYRSSGKDILIYGGAQRGTMYGVYAFLEKEFGIHWLTPKCTVIPHLDQWGFKNLDHSEAPAIGYRYSNYFVANTSPAWSAHTKENMKWNPVESEYGDLEAYWSAHTMGMLVQVKEFFDVHPEYFCQRDGKRISYGQLCLSNPQVLNLCKERLAQKMRELPAYRIYSLSQNDNQLFCECSECKAIEERYGGHSGLMVWFVNQVADAVKDEFPDKYVGTFAYQYTRKPPVGIKPRNNVVIRLCSIECCFAHPLDAGCPQNEAFMDDIKRWAELAPHLFIWDYIVDYAQYIAPWPNFQVLGPNIEVFRKNKAIGIFEEAQYQSAGAEFDEMKAWTVNQLLWNPKQNVDSLVNIFISGFYGKAAPKIWEYYRLCQSLVMPDVHYGIYINAQHEIYSDEFTRRAFELLNEARQLSAGDEMISERVEQVRMQPLYLQCMRHFEESKSDGTWQEFVGLMRKYKARPNEPQTIERFLELHP